MPSVMIDTAYPHSDRAYRLCRVLGNSYADILPVRLWCWGIETDRKDGHFIGDAKRLAEIVRYDGNPEELLDAFVLCEIIEKIADGDEYRIKGWARNAKFFRERDRLRKYNATRSERADASRATRVPRGRHEVSSSSSSSSSSPPSEGGDLARASGAQNTPPPPPIETMQQARAQLVTGEQKLELFEHWQSEHHRRWKSAKVLVPPTAQLEQAALVLTNAGGDMAVAKAAVTAMVGCDRGYWHDTARNALYVLTDPRDFERARLTTTAKEKPRVRSFLDEP